MNKRVTSLLGTFLISFPLLLWSRELIEEINFRKVDLSFSRFKEYDVVSLKDAVYTNELGAPMLPCYQARILIPQGATATQVKVISCRKDKLPGEYNICPTQPPRPISVDREVPFTLPDSTVYSSSASYPGELVKLVGTGEKGGYKIAELLIYPVQYIPYEKSLTFFSHITLKLKYEDTHTATGITKFQKESIEPTVRELIVNTELLDMYAPPLLEKQNEIRYCIITSSSFLSEFQRLADWKTKKGVRAKVVCLDSIYNSCPGIDNPAKIRKFISDARSNWGTQYFLLGGQCDFENSQEIVPRRDAFCLDLPYGYYSDEDTIPCDLYYSDLDGTWDGNGNGIYGETGDGVNMYSDVFVGRAPVSNLTQVQNFVNKVLTYECNPPTGYEKKILLPAVLLFPPYAYWGDIVNDAIANVTPTDWEDAKLYESNGTLSEQEVIDSINAGFGFTHYSAHGNEYGVYTAWAQVILNSADVNNLNNGNKIGVHNSIACFSGAVDEVAGGDCFAEHLINKQNGGAVASIMNSRYGFGRPPDMYASELMDLEFYKKLFNANLYHLGEAHAASKDAYVTNAQSDAYFRYCVYELNLFGDPELPMWTDEPKELTVNHPSTIFVGLHSFEVTCSNCGYPVSNASVCLMKGSEIYTTGTTNSAGSVTFNINIPTSGALWITATARNFLPYEGYATVSLGATVSIEPDTIQVNNPTDVEITVYGFSNVEVKIAGLGVSKCDTTNAAGVCTINVNAPYGEVLKCTGSIGRGDCFTDSIWVTEANDLNSPNILAQSSLIGLTDTLTTGYEGILTGTSLNSGFTIFAKGCGIDTSAYTDGTSIDLSVVPTSFGSIYGYIAKSGYKVYTKSFPVLKVFGSLAGTVTHSITNNGILGAIIKGYEKGVDTLVATPIFIDTADASGNWSSYNLIQVNEYDIYASKFGYFHYSTTKLVKHGVNTLYIKLQPLPTGVVYGVVTDSVTGAYLSNADIRICRADNSELYNTVATDDNGNYAVTLPYFTYKFHVLSYNHTPKHCDVTVNSDSLRVDFAMSTGGCRIDWACFQHDSAHTGVSPLKGDMNTHQVKQLWSRSIGGYVTCGCALGDIDGDGKLEVVVGSSNGKVYALNGEDGSKLWSYTTSSYVYSSPALGDIDSDTKLEVVFGAWDDFTVYALNGENGSKLWSYKTNSYVCSSPALGDIDKDDTLEVVIGSYDSLIYALNGENGSKLWSYKTGGPAYASPAIGDIDKDDKPEVVAGGYSDRLYAINGEDGSELWTASTWGSVSGGYALGDIDGDNKLEVVFVDCTARAFAWNGENGSLLWRHEDLLIIGGANTTAAIGDVNGDGKAEVVYGGAFKIYALNKTGPPQQVEEQVSSQELSVLLLQNTPNPFSDYTSIRYALPINTKVSVNIYNLLGQKVATIVNEHQLAGWHTISWNGRDGKGDKVAGGIYFCKLTTSDGKSFTRKLILLKK
ncbi:MAG: C25 family cysteine peptidase [bacterium]|nr:C25 family cysteine peptidase [bacterium]